ncbi:MAG TPA: hypothetical protein VF316_12710 [Polyangiaceae bacterium]
MAPVAATGWKHFGVVEEGIAWFGDSGQGGPADNLLEVKIVVLAGDGGVAESDAGEAGTTTHGDASTVEPDGGADDPGPLGGCSLAPPRSATSSWTGGLATLLAVGLLRWRRWRAHLPAVHAE